MVEFQAVFLSYLIVIAMCVVVSASLWRRYRYQFDGISFWFAGYLVAFITLILASIGSYVPVLLVPPILNTAVVGSYFLLYMGLERFTGKISSQIHNIILLVIIFLLNGYFTYLKPSILARHFIVSLGYIIINFQGGWLIFRRSDPDVRKKTTVIGIILVSICLTELVHFFYNIGRLFELISTDNPIFHALVYMITQGLVISLAFGLFILVNQRLDDDLREAKSEIITLSGLIPICANCRKVRDDEGYWKHLESYIEQRSEAKFSHGICEKCAEKLYGDKEWYKKRKQKSK